MIKGRRIITSIMLVLAIVCMSDVKRLPRQQHLHMRRMTQGI